MPDGNNSPDVNYSSLGQDGRKILPADGRPVTPEVDPMAHATKLKNNPAEKNDEDDLLKLLGSLPKEKPVSATPSVVEKIAKKPAFSLFKKTEKPEQSAKTNPTIKQSQGFLMPLVNWVNGVGNAVWKFATSWIPMKQTGTGTA